MFYFASQMTEKAIEKISYHFMRIASKIKNCAASDLVKTENSISNSRT